MWKPGGPNAPRVADTLAGAVANLADPRPPMRVGALRTLEALGQEDPLQRQAIVDILCAYLRMPIGEEGPARATAQRILTAHLRPRGGAFWTQTSLDLTGATLLDLDLSGCHVDGGLRLEHATLLGQTKARGLVVRGPASLYGASFADQAWFERSAFHGPVRFDVTDFHGDAWFGGATFGGRTTFAGSTFGGHAWFSACTFLGPVQFDEAVFRRSAGFRGAEARGGVGLSGTTFLGPARVSLRGEDWNICASGWRVVVDSDNEAVGQLLWVGHPELVSGQTPP